MDHQNQIQSFHFHLITIYSLNLIFTYLIISIMMSIFQFNLNIFNYQFI